MTLAVYQLPWHVQAQISTQMGMIMGFITLAPPSTTIFAPLTYDENPHARKPVTLATSFGCPARSSGIVCFWAWVTSIEYCQREQVKH